METQLSPTPSPAEKGQKRKLPFSVWLIICFVALMAVLSIVFGVQACSRRNDVSTKAITDNGKAVLANGNFDQMSSQATTSAVKQMIKKVYTASYSASVKKNLDQLKKKNVYSLLRPLIVHNPYGTNTTSLYAYFKTDEAVKVPRRRGEGLYENRRKAL
jgi:hypothetical protein